MAAPISLLLVDNHPLVLDGLKAILQTYDHLQVVATATDAQEGVALAAALMPDVVLLDINMPRLNGIDAIERFRTVAPQARILMLSMHDNREYISSSVLRGASGYILKEVSTGEIVAAIETVMAGGTFFSSGVNDAILEARTKVEASSPGLTAREQDILMGIATGRNNRDLAETLGLSIATVETHRKHLKKKLGIATTAGLVRYALDHGIAPEGVR
ncbi:DNA-binding response regulator [Xaviernesmea oryzae]|uniref:DNA-binding response regulator n=1 Tax=Xaviernesmea oryzae TaxID=464029 RepID=A0A1Q9AYW7_9HYPH|nr:response regulator transcription factor [Xaviernesmea oryzae]OLP60875.1 DNA-binding response regulator [Xaviernesmea oryzae]SEL23297.1 two component transcriptional regulator, LuxR family [Xaviernesmea oryzae]